MTAPTEAEIRAALEERTAKYPSDNGQRLLDEAVDKAFDVVGYIELDENDALAFGAYALSDLWEDLRPTEVVRLHQLVRWAQERAKAAAWEAIIQECVAAGLKFAAEYPDAPRAAPEAVAA